MIINLFYNRRLAIVITILITACIVLSCDSNGDDPKPISYELLVKERDQYAAFSPDGKLIVYCHSSGQIPEPTGYPSGIYTIDLNGGNRKLVLAGSDYFNPSWSPDGEWLVFSHQGIIQKCTIDGDHLTTFSGLNNLDYPAFFYTRWSSDGRYIVFDKPFRTQGDTSNGGLYYTNSDYSNPGLIFGIKIISGRDPEISPDGKHFIYYDWINDGITMSELFLIRIADSQKIRLTNDHLEDTDPTWSADGKKIAWCSNRTIQTMNMDGTNTTTLAFGNSPSWSKDNLIVYSYANDEIIREVLFTINADGSNKKQITF